MKNDAEREIKKIQERIIEANKLFEEQMEIDRIAKVGFITEDEIDTQC